MSTTPVPLTDYEASYRDARSPLEQPEYVFWAPPARIPRGADQNRWKERSANWPISYHYSSLCAAAYERLNGPVAPTLRPLTQDQVRAMALELGARDFGVTTVDPRHVFRGC